MRPRPASIDKGFPDKFSTGSLWRAGRAKGRAQGAFSGPLRPLSTPSIHTCGESCGSGGKPCKMAVFGCAVAPRRGHCRTRCTLLCSALAVVDGGAGTGRVEQPIELTAESLWTEVAGRLKGALNDSTYRTWFGEVEGMEVTDDS